MGELHLFPTGSGGGLWLRLIRDSDVLEFRIWVESVEISQEVKETIEHLAYVLGLGLLEAVQWVVHHYFDQINQLIFLYS